MAAAVVAPVLSIFDECLEFLLIADIKTLRYKITQVLAVITRAAFSIML